MTIDLKNGTSTDGQVDYRHLPELFNMHNIDLNDNRVLDIASNDGFWAFWAEDRGAKVLSIDVDTYNRYDWGHDIPENYLKHKENKADNFNLIKGIRKSNVERRSISIYDLNAKDFGQFDLVLNFGLMYHLRHPLLALDKMREVCSSTAIIRTSTFDYGNNLPISMFLEDDVIISITNWTIINVSCMLHWLKNVGFKHLFIENRLLAGNQMLTYFACLKKDKFYDRFKGCNYLKEIDNNYFLKARNEIKNLWGKR